MFYQTLISTDELKQNLGDEDWVIVDCRFSLDDTGLGRREYLKAHIPGAVYAHLDQDLSGRVIPGKTGRHPLPQVGRFIKTLERWGIGQGVQVVTYDDSGGSIAARLWWLLHWLGHDAVAVLDGGWQRWLKDDGPVKGGNETPAEGEARQPRRTLTPHLRQEMLVSGEEVEAMRLDPAYLLLDARSADRYRGENENRDPVAGHIPGAISAPYANNLTPDGSFISKEQLQASFKSLLGDIPAERAIFYCGSGVTAAHDVLALEHAGLGNARLYAGSWSEWITDPEHPVETGE